MPSLNRRYTGCWFTRDGKPIEFVNLPDPAERQALKEAAKGLYDIFSDFVEAGFSRNEAIALVSAFLADTQRRDNE